MYSDLIQPLTGHKTKFCFKNLVLADNPATKKNTNTPHETNVLFSITWMDLENNLVK